MGKLKTRRALLKRYKITGQNKVLRRKAGKGHLLAKKSSNRKRFLSKAVLVKKHNLACILFYTNIN
uniref:Large ribosomal subunit protein bL35c n=1 Tax=Bulboplastis apyrenoidosa TaxID=1070855 RepID=A0A1Y9TM75_9RHOD|nr:50S ribosomal protein L35 [Bulboplastis apyrenoidosa]ARO90734.1 50S ribosomal protein L35 [Bulboplastis apyrenoidosa]